MYYLYDVFFFNDTATTEIYTLSLHDALPIFRDEVVVDAVDLVRARRPGVVGHDDVARRRGRQLSQSAQDGRSEEHTSELQSRQYLVCRLLLEKNNTFLPYIPKCITNYSNCPL